MGTRAYILARFLYAGVVFGGASGRISALDVWALDIPVGYGPIAQNLQYTGVLLVPVRFTFLAHMGQASRV